MALAPDGPEPPEGSILLSLGDDWQWQHVRTSDGVGWLPIHLMGRPVVLQNWSRVAECGPFEVIRWGSV